MCPSSIEGVACRVLLFIGDDWAEDHHDLELEDETGRRLAKTRLPEGLEGITRYIELRYNQIKLHSALGYRTPNEVEWEWLDQQDAA